MTITFKPEKRKKFDRIFKENAVRLSYEKEQQIDAAEELGISPSLICRWRKEYEKFGSGSFLGQGYPKVHPDNRTLFDLEKKLKESELRYEILKKSSPFLFKEKTEIFQFIKDHEKTYSITKMCKVLGVGITTYIRWKKKGTSEKKKQIAILKKDIKEIFLRFKKQCGRNHIARELKGMGYKISERQVTFYMQQLGLRRIKKRKYKVTTDSNHPYHIPPNLLNRNFKANAPCKIWVSDITYIQTKRGFLYLTVILDLYDRKIVGWSLCSGLTAQHTTLPAWKMAIENHKVSEGLVFHSDRGVQYANKIFSSALESCGCIRSMSRKGNCWDNAVSEGFFSLLKRELLYGGPLLSNKRLKAEIFDYIENWYNKKRIHTSLDFKTIPQYTTI